MTTNTDAVLQELREMLRIQREKNARWDAVLEKLDALEATLVKVDSRPSTATCWLNVVWLSATGKVFFNCHTSRAEALEYDEQGYWNYELVVLDRAIEVTWKRKGM